MLKRLNEGSRLQGSLDLPRFPSSTLLPFFFLGPLLKPNSRKKGTLIIKGLLGNLDYTRMLKRLNEGSRLQGSLDLPRFPSSTLLPFLFLGSLIKTE